MLGPESVSTALLDAGQAPDDLREQSGIIPLSIFELFDQVARGMRNNTDYTIKCSYLEIYNESVNDLLSIPPAHNLRIREFPRLGMCVIGSVERTVSCPDDVFQCLALGTRNRMVCSTELNQRSSRSHTLFVVGVEQKMLSGTSKFAKINLVDLAGSEKVSKTGASGQALKEAQNINLSLTTLGRCIKALSSRKDEHIPFRESKLTMILKEALGGNAKTSLICTASQKSYHLEETKGTLKFAERAKKVQNKATSNIKRSPEELLAIIDQLKVEIASLRKQQTKKGLPELIPRPRSATFDDEIYVKYAELKAQFDGLAETSQFEIEKLQAEKEHLTEVNLDLASNLQDFGENNELMKEQQLIAEVRYDHLRTESEKEILEVRTSLETTLRELAIVKEELKATTERLNMCKGQLQLREQELEVSAEQVKAATLSVQMEAKRCDQLTKDVLRRDEQITTLTLELTETRQKMRQSSEQEITLQLEIQQITCDKESIETQLSLAQSRNSDLSARIQDLSTKLQAAETRYNDLFEVNKKTNHEHQLQLLSLSQELEECKKTTAGPRPESTPKSLITRQRLAMILQEMTDLQTMYQDSQVVNKMELTKIKENYELKVRELEQKITDLSGKLEAEMGKNGSLSKQLKMSLVEVDSLKFYIGKRKGEAVSLAMELKQEKELCESFQRDLREAQAQLAAMKGPDDGEVMSLRQQWKALERNYKSSMDEMTMKMLHLTAENTALKETLASKDVSTREQAKRIEGLKAELVMQSTQVAKLQQAVRGLKQVGIT